MDLLMGVVLPVMLWIASNGTFTLGGPKPVPVNPRNCRRFVKGDVIVSLAGIAVNLVLFVLFAGLFALVGFLGNAVPGLAGTLEILQRMMFYGMWLNLVLAFFNLIPIPPLDGRHVFYHLLPAGAGPRYRQLYALGFVPILAVSWFAPGVISVFLWPAHQLMSLGLALVGGFQIPVVS